MRIKKCYPLIFIFLALKTKGSNINSIKLSDSKSARCFYISGEYFQMVFPNLKVEFDGISKTIRPGDICYKFVTKQGQESKGFFPMSNVGVFQNGPNQALTLFDNSGPVVYVAWGFVNGYGAEPQAKGAIGKWAPWNLGESKLDLNCQLYESAIEKCTQ